MIEIIKDWIINIVTVIIFISFIEVLMPNSNMKKYLNLILGFVVIIVILNPIIELMKSDTYFDDELLRVSMDLDQSEYAFSSNNIESVQKTQLVELYKNKIGTEIKERLKTKYEVDVLDIEIDIEEDIKERNGEINGIKMRLARKEDTKEEEIQIVSINISNDGDKVNNDKEVEDSIKDSIREDISSIYNIADSSVIVN